MKNSFKIKKVVLVIGLGLWEGAFADVTCDSIDKMQNTQVITYPGEPSQTKYSCYTVLCQPSLDYTDYPITYDNKVTATLKNKLGDIWSLIKNPPSAAKEPFDGASFTNITLVDGCDTLNKSYNPEKTENGWYVPISCEADGTCDTDTLSVTSSGEDVVVSNAKIWDGINTTPNPYQTAPVMGTSEIWGYTSDYNIWDSYQSDTKSSRIGNGTWLRNFIDWKKAGIDATSGCAQNQFQTIEGGIQTNNNVPGNEGVMQPYYKQSATPFCTKYQDLIGSGVDQNKIAFITISPNLLNRKLGFQIPKCTSNDQTCKPGSSEYNYSCGKDWSVANLPGNAPNLRCSNGQNKDLRVTWTAQEPNNTNTKAAEIAKDLGANAKSIEELQTAHEALNKALGGKATSALPEALNKALGGKATSALKTYFWRLDIGAGNFDGIVGFINPDWYDNFGSYIDNWTGLNPDQKSYIQNTSLSHSAVKVYPGFASEVQTKMYGSNSPYTTSWNFQGSGMSPQGKSGINYGYIGNIKLCQNQGDPSCQPLTTITKLDTSKWVQVFPILNNEIEITNKFSVSGYIQFWDPVSSTWPTCTISQDDELKKCYDFYYEVVDGKNAKYYLSGPGYCELKCDHPIQPRCDSTVPCEWSKEGAQYYKRGQSFVYTCTNSPYGNSFNHGYLCVDTSKCSDPGNVPGVAADSIWNQIDGEPPFSTQDTSKYPCK